MVVLVGGGVESGMFDLVISAATETQTFKTSDTALDTRNENQVSI